MQPVAGQLIVGSDGVAPFYEGLHQERERDRSERDIASRDDGAASAGNGFADPAQVQSDESGAGRGGGDAQRPSGLAGPARQSCEAIQASSGRPAKVSTSATSGTVEAPSVSPGAAWRTWRECWMAPHRSVPAAAVSIASWARSKGSSSDPEAARACSSLTLSCRND